MRWVWAFQDNKLYFSILRVALYILTFIFYFWVLLRIDLRVSCMSRNTTELDHHPEFGYFQNCITSNAYYLFEMCVYMRMLTLEQIWRQSSPMVFFSAFHGNF